MTTASDYDVLIFVNLPYSLQNLPPIYNMFGPPFNSRQVFNTPDITQKQDTLISDKTGKMCEGCGGTFKGRPVSIDYEIFKIAITEWKKNPSRGIIVVKSSTVSSGIPDASALATQFQSSLEQFPTANMFYFARWLDRPDQYEVLKINTQTGIKTIRTWNPHGMQAVAFTPTGMSSLSSSFDPQVNPVVTRPFAQVLNSLIQNGKISAIGTTPSLLQYDATLISELPPNTLVGRDTKTTTHQDAAKFSYLKTSEARGETYPEVPLNRRISSDLTLFWVVLIILVAGLTIWLLLKIGSIGGGNDIFSNTLTPFYNSKYGGKKLAII